MFVSGLMHVCFSGCWLVRGSIFLKESHFLLLLFDTIFAEGRVLQSIHVDYLLTWFNWRDRELSIFSVLFKKNTYYFTNLLNSLFLEKRIIFNQRLQMLLLGEHKSSLV